MKDILTDNILEGAINLNNLLSDDLVKKVLEIEVNSESTKNNILLTRLIRSLDQYVNKQRDLKYIGLVGHYSSGKSSTINSILNLNESNDKRETGLNPTDKAITLITHPKNSNLLILMSREGVAVPIRTLLIKNELLTDVVLSDTPGSGDPEIVNELIQDFLPICDTIFYFITATNPIDQADIPLLNQKNNKLPFIPLSFVITRTDEFRLDRSKQLSDINLDGPKRDLFLGKLISRIRQTVKSEDLTLDRFIFIDNESQYNIVKLREEIVGATNSIDQEALIRMHGHKVEYYRANLNSIFDYFLKLLEIKIQQCKGFVKTASENISRFDKSVEINNERLKLLWSKNDTNFRDCFNDEKRAVEEIGAYNFTRDISTDRLILNERKALNLLIDQQSVGYMGKLIGDLNLHFKQRLRDIKHNILGNIEKNSILTDNITHLFPARLDFDNKNHSLEIDYSRLNDYIDSLLNITFVLINDAKGNIRSKINQVKTVSNKEILISSLIQLYENGKLSIFNSFEQFFERIQMYRTAVLTKNTKDTIEKLRIGVQLDALDEEFTDTYMSSMKVKAVEEVYVSNDIEIENIRKEMEIIISKSSKLRNEIDGILIEKTGYSKLLKENLNTSVLMNEILMQKEEMVNFLYQEKLLSTLDNHKINFNKYIENLNIIKTKRNKLLWIWFSIVLALSGFLYFGYKYFDLGSPTTTIGEIFVGLGTTILFEIIMYVIINIKTNLKGITAQNEEEFIRKCKSEIVQSFGESFWDDLNRKVEERIETNSSFLKNKLNEKAQPIVLSIINSNQEILNNLLRIHSQLEELLNDYQRILKKFYDKFSIVFSQTESNSDKISVITREIKESSIKPSFELLEETTSNLELVRLKIIEQRI